MEIKKYTAGVLQYIPFFYVIWSDDLLSYSEVSVVKKAIEQDKSLDKKAYEYLLTCLDKNTPPSYEVLKNWKNVISHSQVQLIESDTYPLATFSQKMLCHHFGDCPFNTHLKDIEINLGIQPNHYKHLFDIGIVENVVSNFYNPKEIDTILKGDQATVIDGFRDFLKDPIFEWNLKRDKEAFRLHVLKQVQLLAKKGYGAMSYAQPYGGSNNMIGYAAIFENMMYVDGSWCTIWTFWRQYSKIRHQKTP